MVKVSTLQSSIDFCRTGDYEAAIGGVGVMWPGLGVNPRRHDLSDAEYGRLLLVCAIVSINLGAGHQRNVLHVAKDMLSESARLLHGKQDADTARAWLGVAYGRCGESNEAVAVSRALLADQPDLQSAVIASTSIAICELELGRPLEALYALDDVAQLVPAVPAISRGKYHINRGMILRSLDRLDETVSEYDLASEAFREAKSLRWEAAVSNNLARVHLLKGEFIKAHNAAERAVSVWAQVGDKGHEAKSWDEIARIYLSEGRLDRAERAAQKAVSLLRSSDQEGWLAEALTTHGSIAMKRGISEAIRSLEMAAEINARIGNQIQADSCYTELWAALNSAREMVSSLRETERTVIAYMLERHDRSVTRTARALNLTHQALDKKIKSHQLMAQRTTPKKRHKAIIKAT